MDDESMYDEIRTMARVMSGEYYFINAGSPEPITSLQYNALRMRDFAEDIANTETGSFLKRAIKNQQILDIVSVAKRFNAATKAFEAFLEQNPADFSGNPTLVEKGGALATEWSKAYQEFDSRIQSVEKPLKHMLDGIAVKTRESSALIEEGLEKAATKMSGTKMAVIGGAVAVGGVMAWKLFHKDHPEHSPNTTQR